MHGSRLICSGLTAACPANRASRDAYSRRVVKDLHFARTEPPVQAFPLRMKTLIAGLLLLSLISPAPIRAADPASASVPPAVNRAHRVVVELTSADPKVWSGALNNFENLRQALGAATQVELVAHGNGLGFLLQTNTAQVPRMKTLADAGVRFAACRNTMRRQHVSAEALLPFVVTVDSGVAEIVRRQDDGWAYLHLGG